MIARSDSSTETTSLDEAMDLGALVGRLNALEPHLKFQVGDPLERENAIEDGWLDEADLTTIEAGRQRRVVERLSGGEFGASRRAVSASVLLRYGWSAGLLVGVYLTSGIVLRGAKLRLRFTPAHAALADVSVLSVTNVVNLQMHTEQGLRRSLSDELISHAQPIVEAHHEWSGFSRKALWSMVTSSWGAQFTHISERLGTPERGLAEAEQVLKLDPVIEAARPDMYVVEADGKQGVCQMRRLCCLWFKSGKRQFCASCPIIPADDRLERNRKWIAQRGLPVTSQAAT